MGKTNGESDGQSDGLMELSHREEVAKIDERIQSVLLGFQYLVGEDPLSDELGPHDPPQADLKVLIARIDERTRILTEAMKNIESKLQHRYVSLEEFRPVKQVVFGMVGFLLLSVMGAIVALVIKAA